MAEHLDLDGLIKFVRLLNEKDAPLDTFVWTSRDGGTCIGTLGELSERYG